MNYYDVLGLEPTCSPKDIQSAYRTKAKQHHPDSGGDVDTFHAVAEAYEVLKDPHKRAAFDVRNSRRQNIKINTVKSFEAGCNIVLHCNGKLNEMKIVAKNSPLVDAFTIKKTSQFYKILS